MVSHRTSQHRDPRVSLAIVALVIAAVADVTTTIVGLSHGYSEGNVMVKPLLSMFGPYILVVLKGLAVSIIVAGTQALPSARHRLLLLAFPTLLWGGAAVWNGMYILP